MFTYGVVHVLMCCLCACKKLSYSGYDKFGGRMQKGDICYRRNKVGLLKVIRGDTGGTAKKAWDYNLSAKRYKDHFGEAVAADPGMSDSSHEWFRNVVRGKRVDRVLCCPEDIARTSRCRHDETIFVGKD